MRKKKINIRDLLTEDIYDELRTQPKRVRQLVGRLVLRSQFASYMYGKHNAQVYGEEAEKSAKLAKQLWDDV